jgi:hypothetical protein
LSKQDEREEFRFYTIYNSNTDTIEKFRIKSDKKTNFLILSTGYLFMLIVLTCMGFY